MIVVTRLNGTRFAVNPYLIERIPESPDTHLLMHDGSTHAAVSQQRSEAIRLMRDGLTAHFADDPGQPFEPQSRITPRRRNDYLTQLSQSTSGGITRAAFPEGPVLNEAV